MTLFMKFCLFLVLRTRRETDVCANIMNAHVFVGSATVLVLDRL